MEEPTKDQTSLNYQNNQEGEPSVFYEKARTFFGALQYYLIQIWPGLQRFIQWVAYSLWSLLKAFFNLALQEMGLKKE